MQAVSEVVLGSDTTAPSAATRRDRLGLMLLEAAHRLFAVGILVALAVRAAVDARDGATKALVVTATMIALVHLACAFRIRAGREVHRRGRVVDENVARHPYRVPAVERTRLPQPDSPPTSMRTSLAATVAVLFITLGFAIGQAVAVLR